MAGLNPWKKIMLGAVAALAVLVPAIGQRAPRYTFEVASVKPAPERDYGTQSTPTGLPPAIQGDPATIIFNDVSLDGVISRAYDVRTLYIKAPEWMQQQRYDIHAKVPADAPKGHILEMLQNLLADRFQMKLHWETHEEPGYLLTVAKGGPKLTPGAADKPRAADLSRTGHFELRQSAPDAPQRVGFSTNGHYQIRHYTMGELANSLTADMGKPVVDNTGLAGAYDIAYDAARDSMPGSGKFFANAQQDPELPTIFQALHLLGLELKVGNKVPVKSLVVDSALKAPTAN